MGSTHPIYMPCLPKCLVCHLTIVECMCLTPYYSITYYDDEVMLSVLLLYRLKKECQQAKEWKQSVHVCAYLQN